ncbi:MAG: hotdog fold thioesterase [Herpetosiphon sp.]
MDENGKDVVHQQGLIQLLGIKIKEQSPERVVATMPVTPEHLQPFGYLHGGASVVLAETVASMGAFGAAPAGKAAFGLEINANHVRPKREGLLTATAVPLHLGQQTHVWDVKIVDEQQRLICVSRCTVAIVDMERRGQKTGE